MSNQRNVVIVRAMSILTILTLIWAWHFLMAIVASAESRTPQTVTLISPSISDIRTTGGRRDGNLTREERRGAIPADLRVATLHQRAVLDMIRGNSFPVLSIIAGALIICLITPIRKRDAATLSIEGEEVKAKAA